MNDDVEKKIAAAATNPVGALLLQAIDRANTAEALHHLTKHEILTAKEISEEQRCGLQEAVKRRFSLLNAAVLNGASKPRWSHLLPRL